MNKVLVPVDGSKNSDRAVEHVVRLIGQYGPMEVCLLNVQPPIESGNVRRFVTQEVIDNYHHEEGNSVLASARRLLDAAGIHYGASVEVGHIAATIADYVKRQHCDSIVMGTRGMGSIGSLAMGSIATKVLHLADVPVTLVK